MDSPFETYFEQIHELIRANGWEKDLELEKVLGVSPSSPLVRIRLSSQHLTAPHEIVNDYQPGIHPFEQVQQECLRALRTGRPGL